MTTQSINLNVIPGGVLPRVNVSQYDKGLEQIVATLYEGSSAFEMPSSATVYVQGTKKDGTGFQYTCSYSNNVVTIDLTEQMTVFAGEVVTELVIFDSSNNRIATCNFIIYVESTALSDDTIISETDLPIIQTIPESVSACESYAELAHQWATYGSSDTPSSTNNSKYWASKSQEYAQGALHWKGSIAFASIPTSNLTVGDLYNITNDFTTDSRFIEGSGKKCAAGTNIVWSDSSKWDILTSATYASQVKYSNTDSGLSATNVQDALDEEYELIDGINYANGILGAKNLLPYPYYSGDSYTTNGVTFTVNDDLSVTANGTATSTALFLCRYRETHNLKAGTYRFNGCPSGGSRTSYYQWLGIWDGSTNVYGVYETGSGANFVMTKEYEDYYLVVGCYVYAGQTVSNLTFYPMIRLATDTDDTYQPYAKTNKELTDELDNLSASDVSYDNTTSGLESTDVQGAISELNVGLTELNTSLSDMYSRVQIGTFDSSSITMTFTDTPDSSEYTLLALVFGNNYAQEIGDVIKRIDHNRTNINVTRNDASSLANVSVYGVFLKNAYL